MPNIETMNTADFPFAVDLANTLDWDMAKADFEYMLMLEPKGCFVLWESGERIGMATCVSYRKMGWFGNLAVKPECRRKGAGTLLVKHAVQYLKKKGAEVIGLYAYQHLIGFYRNIGFKPLDDFVVLTGTVNKPKNDIERLPIAVEKDIRALTEFDSQCMGWERKKLVESILREEGNLCYFKTDQKGGIQGFIMAKVYGRMAEVGPLICRNDKKSIAIELIKNTLQKLEGLDLYACAPLNDAPIIDIFLNFGLREKFRVTRMFLGSTGAESCTYLPESLERG